MLDQVLGGFLDALAHGSHAAAVYGLPLLTVLATIAWYKDHGAALMTSGYGMGDALASALLFCVSCGIYYWLLVNLVPMTDAALQTAVQWGALGDASVTLDVLRKPSVLIQLGYDIASPLAQFDSVWRTVKGLAGFVANPADGLVWLAIVGSFIGLALSLAMVLVEFHLAVLVTSLLLPCAIWRQSASLAEFAVGWTLGCLIRILLTMIVVGLGAPVFAGVLTTPRASVLGVTLMSDSLVLVAGSLFFALLAWVIPSKAARMASGASLGLTGSTIASAAMTGARFAMMGSAALQGSIRGVSQMVQRSK